MQTTSIESWGINESGRFMRFLRGADFSEPVEAFVAILQ